MEEESVSRERLFLELEQLNRKLDAIQQEKADLEILLETTTEHSDTLLDDVQREKADLEILLETTTEHSDTLEAQLQNTVEKVIRQSEEQLQLIAEASPAPILITQVDGTILYANAASSATFGLSIQELLGRPVQDFYVDLTKREQVLADFVLQGSVQNCEFQLKRADGSPFWVITSLRPFLFNGTSAILGTFWDISDRKQAEESLRFAEAKYRSIFENALEGIFQITPDGRYLNVNPAMAQLYGYESPAQMIAEVTDITQQIYGDSTGWHDRDWTEQDEVKEFEYQVYRRDRSLFWVAEWARPVCDEAGHLLYYEGACIDITQRKREEAALRQQMQQLRIEIDKTKQAQKVAEIVETDSFNTLKQKLKKLKQVREEREKLPDNGKALRTED